MYIYPKHILSLASKNMASYLSRCCYGYRQKPQRERSVQCFVNFIVNVVCKVMLFVMLIVMLFVMLFSGFESTDENEIIPSRERLAFLLVAAFVFESEARTLYSFTRFQTHNENFLR